MRRCGRKTVDGYKFEEESTQLVVILAARTATRGSIAAKSVYIFARSSTCFWRRRENDRSQCARPGFIVHSLPVGEYHAAALTIHSWRSAKGDMAHCHQQLDKPALY